jgi:hypothetical protein
MDTDAGGQKIFLAGCMQPANSGRADVAYLICLRSETKVRSSCEKPPPRKAGLPPPQGGGFKSFSMELELIRTYYSSGTNGKLFLSGCLLMYTIELPWKSNLARVSCIPEGSYELVKRWRPKFNRHLQVMNVPQRSFILIHPANDAMHELKGCIAPVTLITGAGRGIRSRQACEILNSLVYDVFERHDRVYLIIKSDPYESS